MSCWSSGTPRRSRASPASTAVIPSIAACTNAGTSIPSSIRGKSIPSSFADGRSTPLIPASVQRTAQRPSAVSKVIIDVVIACIGIWNPAAASMVASAHAGCDLGSGWRARIRTWNPLIQSQVLYR